MAEYLVNVRSRAVIVDCSRAEALFVQDVKFCMYVSKIGVWMLLFPKCLSRHFLVKGHQSVKSVYFYVNFWFCVTSQANHYIVSGTLSLKRLNTFFISIFWSSQDT